MQALLLIALVAIATSGEAAVGQRQQQGKPNSENKDSTDKREQLLGCWMMIRDHNPNPNQLASLSLLKLCMNRLTNEDARIKITEFIGKNTVPAKRLPDIVSEEEMMMLQESGQISDYDRKLLEYLQKYESEMKGMQQGRERQVMREKVDEEISKRQKYYLGFIPINKLTTIMMLITGGVFLIFLCSCCRYRSKKDQKKQKERKQQREKVEFYKVANRNNNEVLKKLMRPKAA